MNGYTDSSDVQAQLERFKKSDEERDVLVTSIINAYDELKVKFDEQSRDYSNEKDSRRRWQQEHEVIDRQLKSVRQTIDTSSFVLALIDGDGVIFQDALLSAGRDGGSDAAFKLRTEIRNHILSLYENAGQWDIMVTIFANLEGLSHKLASVNIIKNSSELNAFVQSFSFNQALFSIVDVGRGKERADHKLKEILRVFILNPSCRHILFAGCSDFGYLPNLEPYKHDPAISSRITLLESTPAQRGYADLNMRTVRFDSVFRSTPLPETPPQLKPKAVSPVLQTPQPVRPTVLPVRSMPPVVTQPVRKSPTPPADPTWASVGKAGTTKKQISIAPRKNNRPYIIFNADGQRLDLPIAKAEKHAQESLYQRIKASKVCNDHHLKGSCENQGCFYSHAPRLSAMETLALRNKARGLSCPAGSDCADVDCYYGHVCSAYFCNGGSQCYFGKKHKGQMDMTPAVKYYDDGTSENIGSF